MIQVKELGYRDLTEYDNINLFMSTFKAEENDEVIIDLAGCLIGYETSKLIRLLLEKMSNPKRRKTLILSTNYKLIKKDRLWEWFFKKNTKNWEHLKVDGKSPTELQVLVSEFYNIDMRLESK